MDDRNTHAIRIYDRIAEDYAKNYDSIESDEDMEFAKAFVAHLPVGAHIVDIGCGTGFSAGWFKKHGMHAEGADLSESMIAIARRNYPDIPFAVADMRGFAPAEKADAVWAGYSMFHFDQAEFEKTIGHIKTYLKPGGIFGLVMQEGSGGAEVPEPFLPGETIYVQLYSEAELVQILESHDFDIVERRRKPSQHVNEFAFDKILLIARLRSL